MRTTEGQKDRVGESWKRTAGQKGTLLGFGFVLIATV